MKFKGNKYFLPRSLRSIVKTLHLIFLYEMFAYYFRIESTVVLSKFFQKFAFNLEPSFEIQAFITPCSKDSTNMTVLRVEFENTDFAIYLNNNSLTNILFACFLMTFQALISSSQTNTFNNLFPIESPLVYQVEQSQYVRPIYKSSNLLKHVKVIN